MTDRRAEAFRVSWPAGTEQVPESFFDHLYATDADPWALGERWYEHRKYEVTMASLPRRRYRRGLEVGCSIGLLTTRLASRCEHLVSGDVADRALRETRRRLQENSLDTGAVEVRHMAPPDVWPEGTFDLIVLSEVLYFSAGERLDRFIDGAVERLRPGGQMIAVHYRPATDVHLLTGDAVHGRLLERSGLTAVVRHLEAEFLLDVLQRNQA